MPKAKVEFPLILVTVYNFQMSDENDDIESVVARANEIANRFGSDPSVSGEPKSSGMFSGMGAMGGGMMTPGFLAAPRVVSPAPAPEPVEEPAYDDFSKEIMDRQKEVENIVSKHDPKLAQGVEKTDFPTIDAAKNWALESIERGAESISFGSEKPEPDAFTSELHQLSPSKVSPEIKAEAAKVMDPVQLKQWPAWLSKTDAQHRAEFDQKHVETTMAEKGKEAWNVGVGVGKGLLGVATRFGSGVAKAGATILKGPGAEGNFFDSKEWQRWNTSVAKLATVPAVSVAESLESVVQTASNAFQNGLSATDWVNEQLPVEQGGITREEAFQNYLGRKRADEYYAGWRATDPNVFTRVIMEDPKTRELAENMAYSLTSIWSPSVDDRIQRHNGDREAAMREKQLDDLRDSQQLVSNFRQEAAQMVPDPDLTEAAGWTRFGMNPFDVYGRIGGAGMRGISKGIKAASRVGKTAEQIAAMEAEAAAKAFEAELKAAEAAKTPGWVEGFAGKVADKVEPAAAWMSARYSDLPESVQEGLAKMGSGMVGTPLTKTAAILANAGVAAPRIAQAALAGRRLAAGGVEGGFEAGAKAATEAAAKTGLSPRAQQWLANKSIPAAKTLDWMAQNSMEMARGSVHGATLAAAVGVLENKDIEEIADMMGQGIFLHLGGEVMGNMTGVSHGRYMGNLKRQRASAAKWFNELDPATQAHVRDLGNWDSYVKSLKGLRDSAENKYAHRKNEADNVVYSGESPENIQAAQEKANDALIELNIRNAQVRNAEKANSDTQKMYRDNMNIGMADVMTALNGSSKAGRNVEMRFTTADELAREVLANNRDKGLTDLELIELFNFVAGASAEFAFIAENGGKHTLSSGKTVDLYTPYKDRININIDSIKARMGSGESALNAFGHEAGHAFWNVKEFREGAAETYKELFGNQKFDERGNLIGGDPGLFSVEDLINKFKDSYARGYDIELDPSQLASMAPEQQKAEAVKRLAQKIGLWDPVMQELDPNKTAAYMRHEMMAELIQGGAQGGIKLGADPKPWLAPLVDWATTKQKNTKTGKKVRSAFGLTESAPWDSDLTGTRFSSEQIESTRNALRAVSELNGDINAAEMIPHAPITETQLRSNEAVANQFGEAFFAHEKVATVLDRDGNVIESRVVTDPNAMEGTFEHGVTETGDPELRQTAGYGPIPAETHAMPVPEGGRVTITSRIKRDASGGLASLTPDQAKALNKARANIIRKAILDAPDREYPGRMDTVSADELSLGGRLSPKQIEAIKGLPETIIPFGLKRRILEFNDLLVRDDGDAMIGLYGQAMDRQGRYKSFAPKIVDFVPLGMRLSKDGNILFNMFSKTGMREKLRRWQRDTPELLSLWNGDGESFMGDVRKVLENWKPREGAPAGLPGETGLDADLNMAISKKNRVNDFLNIFRKTEPESLTANPARTTIRRPARRLTKAEKLDEESSDPNTLIRSYRVDRFHDLEKSSDAPFRVNYGKALYNLMPAKSEAEQRAELPPVFEPSILKGLRSINAFYMGSGAPATRVPSQEELDAMKAKLPKYSATVDVSGNRNNLYLIKLFDESNNQIGFAHASRSLKDPTSGLEVETTHIMDDYRGKGYGQAMYREIAKLAQELGLSKLTASTTSRLAANARSKILETNWRGAGWNAESNVPSDIRFMPSVAVVPERFTGTGEEEGRRGRYVEPPKAFKRFDISQYEPGGKFFDAETGEDLTNKSYENASIAVVNGKPMLVANNEAETTGTGPLVRTNLFKQKAGWKWVSEGAPDTSTIVSVEGQGKHLYALQADFQNGVKMARYEGKASEPRLRPTGRGELTMGEQIGTIDIRGREHPVYDRVTIGEALDAERPDRGININDSADAFTDMIFRGEKTIETRDQNRSLAPYVGKRVGIISTGKGKAMLKGYADIGEPIEYRTPEEFRAAESQHRVKEGSKFDIKPGQSKFGYPLSNVELLPESKQIPVSGRVASDLSNIRFMPEKEERNVAVEFVDPSVIAFKEKNQERGRINAIKKAYGNDISQIEWSEQPKPIVSIDNDGNMQVEDGHHRMVAFKELGFKQVPVIVVPKEKWDYLESERGLSGAGVAIADEIGDPYTAGQDSYQGAVSGQTRFMPAPADREYNHPEGLFPKTEESKPYKMSAIHKISEDGLLFADKMGGLAVPSIAVVKAGTGIQGFGNITLVGGRNLADPRENPVFTGDAYTQRFPRPEYPSVKAKVAQGVINEFKPAQSKYSSGYGDNVTDIIWDNAVNKPNPEESINKMKRSNVAKAAFLGEDAPEPVIRAVKQQLGILDTVSIKEWMSKNSFEDIAYDNDEIRKSLGEAILSGFEEIMPPELADKVRRMSKNLVDENGLATVSAMSKLAWDKRHYGETEIDSAATQSALDAALTGKESEFYQWIEDKIEGMYAAPRIRVGRKWEPYTLENIAKVMTSGKIAGVEKSMTQSTGLTAAEMARQLGGLEEMRNVAQSPWGIQSEKAVNEERSRVSEILRKYRSTVADYYTGSTWDAMDDSMKALSTYKRLGGGESGMRKVLSKAGFKNLPDSAVKEAYEAYMALSFSPVKYFESKPQRIVKLNEFQGAIVPDNVSPSVLNVLRENGIETRIIPSEKADDSAYIGSEIDKLKGGVVAQEQAGIRFSPAKLESEYTAAFEAKDEERARGLVDEAAMAAGFLTEKFYHGTPTGGFNEFDPALKGTMGGHARGGFSFTTDRNAAESYSQGFSDNDVALTKAASLVNKAFRKLDSSPEALRIIGEHTYRDSEIDTAPEYGAEFFDESPRQIRDWLLSEAKFYRDKLPELSKAHIEAAKALKSEAASPEVKSVYLRLPEGTEEIDSSRETLAQDVWGLDVRTKPNKAFIVNLDNGDRIAYVASPESIKSADPFTYDNEGRLIPLSERFNTSTGDIRFSPAKLESEYKAAFEAKDEERARGLVDEAAKTAGYKYRMYRGVENDYLKGDAYVFNKADETYFTSDKEKAEKYAFGWRSSSSPDSGAVYDVYLKMENPWIPDRITDAQGWEYYDKKLREQGYDGVIGAFGGKAAAERGDIEVAVVFEPSQIKSADPFTYDNSGNLIPLSERFNAGTGDIRFSPAKKGALEGIQPELKEEERRFFFTTFTERDAAIAELIADGSEKDIERLNRNSILHAMTGIKDIDISIKNSRGVYKGDQEVSAITTVKAKHGADMDAVRSRFMDLAKVFKQMEVLEEKVGAGKEEMLGQVDNEGFKHVHSAVVEIGKIKPEIIEEARKKAGIDGMTMADGRVELLNRGDDNEFIQRYNAFTQAIHDLGGNVGSIGKGISAIKAYSENSQEYPGTVGYDEPSLHLQTERFAGGAEYGRLNTPLARKLAQLGTFAAPAEGKRNFFEVKDVTKEQAKFQAEVAKVFDKLPDNDMQSGLTQEAYAALAKEIKEQYEILTSGPDGLKFTSKLYSEGGEPYKNSDAAIRDIRENNRLDFLKTDADAFGPPGADFSGHPLLKNSGLKDANGVPLLYNDLFRAVHDTIAHGMFGSSFGPVGEEGAFHVHVRTIQNPLARWAMLTETRGQNSWVNYRPEMLKKNGMPLQKGDAGYIPLQERGFAVQKAALLPLEYALTGDKEVDKPIMDLMKTLGTYARGSRPANKQELAIEARVKKGVIAEQKEASEFVKGAKGIISDSIFVDGNNKVKTSVEDVPPYYLMSLGVRPLPNIELVKEKGQKGGTPKDLLKLAQNPEKYDAFAKRLIASADTLSADPGRFVSPKGYSEFMRDNGITGTVLSPPSMLKMLVETPQQYLDLLTGGFHEEKTVKGGWEAANGGLNGVMEMRALCGPEGPPPMVTALHHLWGTLSKQLPPLDQEACWLRLISDKRVLGAIQSSIDGTFDPLTGNWREIVASRLAETNNNSTQKFGNNAKSNANSFLLMLSRHNGRWNEVSDLYKTDDPAVMRTQFWGLNHGPSGIKNKVQGFIGLTFGVKAAVLDRWRWVELHLPMAMKLAGKSRPKDYFEYTGVNKDTPEDPTGIYKNYGTAESSHPAYSTTLYTGLERATNAAINNYAPLRDYLGAHADAGGLHWHVWNAIKNESVGHSSLDLTKSYLQKYGRNMTPDSFHQHLMNSSAYVEGENKGQIVRLIMTNGEFKVERQ